MEYIRPRIRLTNYCNRKCAYCFAQDYLQGQKLKDHISLSEIKIILDKCESSGIKTVAWQGGEPLIHENIVDIIEMHSKRDFTVNIFTNGLFDPMIIDSLKYLDFYMLINLNAPDTYLKKNDYSKIIYNIHRLFDAGLGERIALGFNVYEKNPQYGFFLDVIEHFKIREVRVDLVRPSGSDTNKYIVLNEINSYFETAKRFILDCMKSGAYFTHFDCPFPICELSDENKLFLWRHSVNIERMGQCYSHIDIDKNLNIGSCFCSLAFEGIYLNDFSTILECRDFIKYCEDKYRWNYSLKSNCDTCNLKSEKRCQGGCIGYNRKKEKIIITRKELDKYMNCIKTDLSSRCDNMHHNEILEIIEREDFSDYVQKHLIGDKLFDNLSFLKKIYELDFLEMKFKKMILVPNESVLWEINRFYAIYALALLSVDKNMYDDVINYCNEAIKMAPLFELCNLMRIRKDAEAISL